MHNLCDNAKMSSVSFDNFLERNQECHFSDKTFSVLTQHEISEENFFKHRIIELVIEGFERSNDHLVVRYMDESFRTTYV